MTPLLLSQETSYFSLELPSSTLFSLLPPLLPEEFPPLCITPQLCIVYSVNYKGKLSLATHPPAASRYGSSDSSVRIHVLVRMRLLILSLVLSTVVALRSSHNINSQRATLQGSRIHHISKLLVHHQQQQTTSTYTYTTSTTQLLASAPESSWTPQFLVGQKDEKHPDFLAFMR